MIRTLMLWCATLGLLACQATSADDRAATDDSEEPAGGDGASQDGSTDRDGTLDADGTPGDEPGGRDGGTTVDHDAGAQAGDNPDPPRDVVITLDPSDLHQTLDGFGTSTAWGSVPIDESFDAFFSRTRGAGLTILRNRIPFRERPGLDDGFLGGGNYGATVQNAGTPNAYKVFTLNWDNWDLAATRKVIARLTASDDYELRYVFSTPWTPPNNATSRWKLDVRDYQNAPDVGGYLDPNHYADYADVLADYALGFEEHMGAPLSALSLQNEPNYQVSYESADWSADQFHAFTAVLAREFEKKAVYTRLPGLEIIAPEDPNFKDALIAPTLNDAATRDVIGIVGAHQYEFGPWNEGAYSPAPLESAQRHGKRVWMTEWNASAFSDRTDLDQALVLARLIVMDLTRADVNAFVYWWCRDLVDDAGAPRKVLWALGQFARFARPGATRVGPEGAVGDGVSSVAFLAPDGRTLHVVVVNEGASPVALSLATTRGGLGDVQVTRTAEGESLAAVAPIPGGFHHVNVEAAARSITTFSAPLLR